MSFFEKIPKSVLTALFAISVSALIQSVPLYYLENWLTDIKFRIGPSTPPSGHLELIGIDSRSITDLGGEVRFSDHANLLKKIANDKPINVSYLLDPSKISGSNSEKYAFLSETEKLNDFVVGINEVPVQGELKKFALSPPLESIAVIPGVYTSDKTTFAEDDVSRRTLLWYEGYEYIFPYLANMVTGKNWQDYRGQFELSTSKQVHTDFRKPGAYRIWSLSDVLKSKVPPGTFKNKIVLVGNISQNLNDNLKTPFSRNRYVTSMLEVKASNVDTLISDTSLIHTPDWVNYLVTLLLSLFSSFVVLRMHPARGIVVVVLGGISYFLFSYILFATLRLNIQTAHPLLLLLICYYFFIPYRLIKETKASWEFQQKNKLLMQVEELKTNFISMMSHDLKTPLARIQGMADVALNDPQPLSDDQRSAMKLIRTSTEELTEFVTSILDLGRIESEKVNLKLSSKDINQIIDDICERCDHAANMKNIRINKNQEPLFSMKMDVELMRQALGNIIENAVKYSPENSTVTVETREDGEAVRIQISDQGIGIPEDELKNVFMKFYRSKNAKQSPIKGTGLGLYLANEFVTLHKGTLEVESIPGEGSTFTVVLPTTL